MKITFEENKKIVYVIIGLLILFIILLFLNGTKENEYIYTLKKDGKSKLPYIKIEDKSIKLINDDLNNIYIKIKELNNESYIKYKSNLNDNILSVLVEIGMKVNKVDVLEIEYKTYNIDINTNEVLSNEKLLNKYNINVEQLNGYIMNDLKNSYEDEVTKKYIDSTECSFECYLNLRNYKSVSENLNVYMKKDKLYGYLNINRRLLVYPTGVYHEVKNVYKLN